MDEAVIRETKRGVVSIRKDRSKGTTGQSLRLHAKAKLLLTDSTPYARYLFGHAVILPGLGILVMQDWAGASGRCVDVEGAPGCQEASI